MGFRLNTPDIKLVIDPDAVPGGLGSWGDGELEVTVAGDVGLDSFFDLVERLTGLPSDPKQFTSGQFAQMRAAFRDFGDKIVSWNIEGIEAGADGFMRLPFPLAVAVFAAWQQAAQPDPTLRPALRNGGM